MIYIRISLIAFCIALVPLHSLLSTTNTPPPVQDYSETSHVAGDPRTVSSQLQDLPTICLVQYTGMRFSILITLSELHKQLDYWKSQKIQSIKPLNVVYQKPFNSTIEEHILVLEQEVHNNYYFLGKIFHEFQRAHTSQSIEDMKILLLSIHHCVDRFNTNESHPLPFSDELVIQNYHYINHYRELVSKSIADHAVPSHIRRHWVAYSIGAIAAGAIALYAYKHQDSIPEWFSKTKSHVGNMLHENIYKPIQKASTTLFSQKDDPLVLQSEIDALQANLKEIAREILINRKASPQEIQATLAALEKGNFQFFNNAFKESSKAIKSSLIAGDAVPLLNLQIQRLQSVLMKLVARLDERVLRSNQLSFAFLATIPSFFGIYSVYKGFKGIGNTCYQALYGTKDVRQPIKLSLRIIEQILNNAATGDSTLNFEDQGSLLYQAYQLSNYATAVPKDCYFHFVEDIQELESAQFSIGQKINIIQRIHRSYDFLREKTDS